jgi:hypothetical protein
MPHAPRSRAPRPTIACPTIACPRLMIACPWQTIACPRLAIACPRLTIAWPRLTIATRGRFFMFPVATAHRTQRTDATRHPAERTFQANRAPLPHCRRGFARRRLGLPVHFACPARCRRRSSTIRPRFLPCWRRRGCIWQACGYHRRDVPGPRTTFPLKRTHVPAPGRTYRSDGRARCCLHATHASCDSIPAGLYRRRTRLTIACASGIPSAIVSSP